MYSSANNTPEIRRRQEIEKRIVTKVVDDLLAAGYALNVDDGGEDPFVFDHPLTSREQILGALINTDEDYLYAFKGKDQVGWVRFVYGNDGWDVICDYIVNLEAALKGAHDLVEELS
jgi:hypothetical protein